MVNQRTEIERQEIRPMRYITAYWRKSWAYKHKIRIYDFGCLEACTNIQKEYEKYQNGKVGSIV